jgi:hypothetical protein
MTPAPTCTHSSSNINSKAPRKFNKSRLHLLASNMLNLWPGRPTMILMPSCMQKQHQLPRKNCYNPSQNLLHSESACTCCQRQYQG